MTICYDRMRAFSHGVQFRSIRSEYAFYLREGWKRFKNVTMLCT